MMGMGKGKPPGESPQYQIPTIQDSQVGNGVPLARARVSKLMRTTTKLAMESAVLCIGTASNEGHQCTLIEEDLRLNVLMD